MKITLNERLFLEAFSPSMPRWLQQYLLWHPRKFPNHRHNDYGQPINVSGSIRDYRSGKTYTKGRSPYADDEFQGFQWNRDTGRDRGDVLTAVDMFTNSNGGHIDMSRAEFITAPVPQKRDDPIFSDPNKICFVHLKSNSDETVWVPGHTSEYERFTFSDGRTLTMKQLNSKLLKTDGKDFCYIDLTNPNNFNKDLQSSRYANKAGVEDRWRIPADKLKDWDTNYNGRDKSGYVVIPSVKRFANELKELKIRRIPEQLIASRDSVAQLQKDFNTISEQYMLGVLDDADYDTQSSINSASSYLMEAIKELSNLVRNMPNYKSQLEGNYEYDRNRAVNNITYNLGNINSYVKRAYGYLAPYMPNVIDWGEFDDSIYTDIDIDED